MNSSTLTRFVAALGSAAVTLAILLGVVSLGDPALDTNRMAQTRTTTTVR